MLYWPTLSPWSVSRRLLGKFVATLLAMSVAVTTGTEGAAVAAGVPAAGQEHAAAREGNALPCDLSGYTGGGPRAALGGATLHVNCGGGDDADLRLRLGLDDGQPIARELAVRPQGGDWDTLVTP